MSVEIVLLGEVAVRAGGQPVALGPARQKCVLVALAVDAGSVVPAERVMGRVWGARTPRSGRATLHNHISRLRKEFGGAVTIAHRSDGYYLGLEHPEQAVDLLRFRALCDRARRTGEDVGKAAVLTEALSLWRGEALTGVSGDWVEGERERWHLERWAAEHELVDARLRIGQGEELVAQLAARAAQHPLDERVAGQYMLALHRAGRSADALGHYRHLRERLVDELGTDPHTTLQDLHHRILVAEPALIPAAAVTTGEPVVIPRQLPAAPAPFIGRHDELDRLDTALSAGGVSLISSIGGAGGIGKTWLTLHWAHRNPHDFPDGQLFVDLHGFSPTERPTHPADVLGRFLEALGVRRDHQPADPERRADLYRSLVADKRMLVVLDNAANTDQVTPLLPGGPHCTVLITSRNHLGGLLTRHGARPIHLGVLTDTEAHTLLVTALGPQRAADDTEAVAELIELCGGFPLALGLIAARAVANAHLPLVDIVADLRALGVDALDSEDPTASLPTVLSWSLRHLTDQQRQVFALLGIAPGPHTGLPAAACLADLPEREAHAALRTLTDASLVNRTAGGRYGMHDLVRAYATTVADDLPPEFRDAALRRVLDLYTHTAHAADRLLDPHRDLVPLTPPARGVHLPALSDAAAALAWFDVEQTCLLAAQHTAVALGRYPTVWQLAWSLDTFLVWRGHRQDRITVWRAAADAASHLPDPTTRIRAHRLLGYAHSYLGHHEEALDHLRQALSLAEHHADPVHQAHTHQALAWAWGQQSDDRQALVHARRALNLFRGLDQPLREADELNTVGWHAARLGDYDTAREHCQTALALHRQHHYPTGEATTSDSLGYIEHHSGHHSQAIDHYHHALTLFRDLGNTFEVANTLAGLGHPHAALGRFEQARTAWREALQLYREQGRDAAAAGVRQHLDGLTERDPHTGTTGAQH